VTTTTAIVRALHSDGWSPLPLPAGKKFPPPDGYTGYHGKYPTVEDIDKWEAQGLWTGNVALRLPSDVIGIDVDAYKGGSVDDLEALYGTLPETVWSTSRGDGSGIAMFRVPVGTTIKANPTDAIEAIQAGHRYMVIHPSIHPDTGDTYHWIDEVSGETLDAPPSPEDLPDLPWKWIEGLAAVKGPTAPAAAPQAVQAFIAAASGYSAPGRLRGVQTRLDNYTGSRHDTLVEMACWAMREAAAHCYAATDAIAVLETWWNRVIDDPRRIDGNEFGAAIAWATAQASLDTTRVTEIRKEVEKHKAQNGPPVLTPLGPPGNVDPETGEITDATPRDRRNLPEEFWNARPVLQHIRQAAHSRIRSADAVLLFTLARTAAIVSPNVALPAIVGGRASLNFLGGVVASSGGGKSSAGSVARDLAEINRKDVVADVPPGSGEGLTELYFEMVTEEGPDGKNRKVKRQTKKGAFIYLDEGQALAEMGNRKGATLLPTLRSAWSGEVIGQSNATAETYRVLKPNSYRMSIMVGFQLEYASELIADAAGGTPQRFVFATATDPTIPDVPPEWPGALHVITPDSVAGGSDIEIAPEVVAEVRQRALLSARGEYVPDALDSHADLVRLKVAALVAILDSRADINAEDWHLAGVIMAASGAVRGWVIATATVKAQQSEAARTDAMIRQQSASESAAERRAIIGGAKSIARRAHRVGELATRGAISHAIDSKNRKLATIDSMLDHATEEGWITVTGEVVTPSKKVA